MRLRTIIVTITVVLSASALLPLLERALIFISGIRTPTAALRFSLSQTPETIAPFTIPLTPRFSPVAAAVIGEPPDHLLERLLLDKGARDGVAIGDVVADPSGVYLGRIVAVNNQTSIMAYVSSELDTVTVRVSTTDRALGILRGRGVAGARVDYLEKSSDIPPGTAVVTSEREEHVPAGISIGAVDHVRLDPTGVFQEATLRLPIVFEHIESVVIIRLLR